MKPDNETSQKKKLKSSKKDISAYLRRVFQKPEEKYKKQFHWPKITHPKLPFSNRNIEPIEERTNPESIIEELEKSENNRDKALAAYLKKETEMEEVLRVTILCLYAICCVERVLFLQIHFIEI